MSVVVAALVVLVEIASTQFSQKEAEEDWALKVSLSCLISVEAEAIPGKQAASNKEQISFFMELPIIDFGLSNGSRGGLKHE